MEAEEPPVPEEAVAVAVAVVELKGPSSSDPLSLPPRSSSEPRRSR